jgi:hypothetical protein
MEKQCTKCNEVKLISEFFKDSHKKDGHRPICKDCTRKDREENSKNPDKLRKRRENGLKNQNNKKNKDPDAYRAYNNLIRRKKYESNPIYRGKAIKRSQDRITKLRRELPEKRALDSARSRVTAFLRRTKNSYSKSIGCKRDEFKLHIEQQFQVGMSWENYGEWHIDHIYPLSIAYKEGTEAFAKACNYKNLQPLWASENIKKSNKLIL